MVALHPLLEACTAPGDEDVVTGVLSTVFSSLLAPVLSTKPEDTMKSEGLCIDLHGLHVAEAKAKFDELVVPVLPALGRCVVVTGRGSHSKGGEAALREALVRHARHRALRCAVMQGNGGALEISLPVLDE